MLGVASGLLPVADGGVLTLRDAKLSLGGEMPDRESEQRLVEQVAQLFDGRGVATEIALTIDLTETVQAQLELPIAPAGTDHIDRQGAVNKNDVPPSVLA